MVILARGSSRREKGNTALRSLWKRAYGVRASRAARGGWLGDTREWSHEWAVEELCEMGAVTEWALPGARMMTALATECDLGAAPGSSIGPEMVLLVYGANVNARDAQGEQPLHAACKAGSCEHAEVLLCAGAPVESRDKSGDTPLLCAMKEGNAKVVRVLLYCGAAVGLGLCGDAPLHVACWMDDFEVTRALLEDTRLDPTLLDSRRRTALDVARERCCYASLEAFMECGRPETRALLSSALGQKILDLQELQLSLMCSERTGLVVDVPVIFKSACVRGFVKTLELLVCHGSRFRRSHLEICFKNGQLEAAQLLVACGADVDERNSKGISLLEWACDAGYYGVVDLLLDSGATAHSTVLVMACQRGLLPVAELILSRGVDPMARGIQGTTPMGAACTALDLRVIRMLMDQGVQIQPEDLSLAPTDVDPNQGADALAILAGTPACPAAGPISRWLQSYSTRIESVVNDTDTVNGCQSDPVRKRRGHKRRPTRSTGRLVN